MSENEDPPVIADTGDGTFGAIQAALDEAEQYPDRADPDFWEALGEALQELCFEAEMDATPENLIECLRLHWNDLIQPERTQRRRKRARLRQLRDQRDAEDAGRQALEDEITELEREVGNNGGRGNPAAANRQP